MRKHQLLALLFTGVLAFQLAVTAFAEEDDLLIEESMTENEQEPDVLEELEPSEAGLDVTDDVDLSDIIEEEAAEDSILNSVPIDSVYTEIAVDSYVSLYDHSGESFKYRISKANKTAKSYVLWFNNISFSNDGISTTSYMPSGVRFDGGSTADVLDDYFTLTALSDYAEAKLVEQKEIQSINITSVSESTALSFAAHHDAFSPHDVRFTVTYKDGTYNDYVLWEPDSLESWNDDGLSYTAEAASDGSGILIRAYAGESVADVCSPVYPISTAQYNLKEMPVGSVIDLSGHMGETFYYMISGPKQGAYKLWFDNIDFTYINSEPDDWGYGFSTNDDGSIASVLFEYQGTEYFKVIPTSNTARLKLVPLKPISGIEITAVPDAVKNSWRSNKQSFTTQGIAFTVHYTDGTSKNYVCGAPSDLLTWNEDGYGYRVRNCSWETGIYINAEYGGDNGGYISNIYGITENVTPVAPAPTPVPEQVTAAPAIGSKVTSGNAVYTVTNASTVAYTKPLSKVTSVTIPATVNIQGSNYTVTSITAKAFSGSSSLKKLVIPKTIKSIGKKAFYNCKKLKTITIKSTSLTTKNVGSKAFSKLNAKAVVKVPKKKLSAYKSLLKKKGLSGKSQKVKK